jgi:hypothetical protein
MSYPILNVTPSYINNRFFLRLKRQDSKFLVIENCNQKVALIKDESIVLVKYVILNERV